MDCYSYWLCLFISYLHQIDHVMYNVDVIDNKSSTIMDYIDNNRRNTRLLLSYLLLLHNYFEPVLSLFQPNGPLHVSPIWLLVNWEAFFWCFCSSIDVCISYQNGVCNHNINQ